MGIQPHIRIRTAGTTIATYRNNFPCRRRRSLSQVPTNRSGPMRHPRMPIQLHQANISNLIPIRVAIRLIQPLRRRQPTRLNNSLFTINNPIINSYSLMTTNLPQLPSISNRLYRNQRPEERRDIES